MKIFFESLGCDKNFVDSEMMVKLLRNAGFDIIDEPGGADAIIVNTCCFIEDAKEESINTLLEMAEYKTSGSCRLLAAAGCLAQRYREEIKKDIPEVDAIIGSTGYEDIADVIKRGLGSGSGGKVESFKSVDYLPKQLVDRDAMTGGCYAYLKIAEGCDKCCTYCIIPKVRGRYRSVPMENLVAQAQHLAANGARELILVAQETSSYGADLYGEKRLPKLLEKLSEIEGIGWIRILYCYPEEITDELIDAIKRLPKVCRYLDIPIQHASDKILRMMGRKTDRASIAATVEKLRKSIPDIALRTTLITGFPREDDEDFEELKSFVKKIRFERLGVFAYSREEGSPAAEMDGQIDEGVKEARRGELMRIQQEIAFEKSASLVGSELEAIVEGYLPEDGVYVCRTYMDAPDVDGYAFISSEKEHMSGDFIKVRITGSDAYDLIGEEKL